MTASGWKADSELLRRFQNVGRALLQCDLEDSHSGNISMRWRGKGTEGEKLVITSTGSQKGDLEASDLCFLSTEGTDYGFYKASSETDIHARVLSQEGVGACIHAHAKYLTFVTLDDDEKPGRLAPFVPVDPLGHYHLGGIVPVDWVAVPSGSKEMAETIPKRLADHRVTAIWGHGVFAKARTIEEALFLVCISENSGYIVWMGERAGIDVGAWRRMVEADPQACFSYPPDEYTLGDDAICEFPEEEELVREFRKTGARLFESRITPFHTGSLSVRGVNSILYAPKASMPRALSGPLLRVSLAGDSSDSRELGVHKAIYALTNFQTVAHCYVPEAEALSRFVYPGESEPNERIVPIDAEGSFLYPAIPVVDPQADIETLVRLLHDYRVVIVRGGGVWGVGAQSLSEVLHHPSSVREICQYRIAAFERGLDLRKLESEKGRKW